MLLCLYLRDGCPGRSEKEQRERKSDDPSTRLHFHSFLYLSSWSQKWSTQRAFPRIMQALNYQVHKYCRVWFDPRESILRGMFQKEEKRIWVNGVYVRLLCCARDSRLSRFKKPLLYKSLAWVPHSRSAEPPPLYVIYLPANRCVIIFLFIFL